MKHATSQIQRHLLEDIQKEISIVLKAQYTLDNSNSKIAKHIHRSHSSVAFALDRMLMWYQTFSLIIYGKLFHLF